MPVVSTFEREDDVHASACMRHGHPQSKRAAGEAEQEESYGDEPREGAPVTT